MANVGAAIDLGNPFVAGHPLNRGISVWYAPISNLDRTALWRDVSPKKYHATWTGFSGLASGRATSSAPGLGNGQINLDGSNTWLPLTTNSTDVLSGSDFSVAAWVYRTNTGTLFDCDCNGTRFVLDFGQFATSGYLSCYSVSSSWNSFGAVPASEWHRILVTKSSGGTAIAYLDGIPLGSPQTLGTTALLKYSSFGSQHSLGDFKLSGAIRDGQIWDRLLSPAEALAEFRESRSGYPNRIRRLKSRTSIFAADHAPGATFNPAWAARRNQLIGGGVS